MTALHPRRAVHEPGAGKVIAGRSPGVTVGLPDVVVGATREVRGILVAPGAGLFMGVGDGLRRCDVSRAQGLNIDRVGRIVVPGGRRRRGVVGVFGRGGGRRQDRRG